MSHDAHDEGGHDDHGDGHDGHEGHDDGHGHEAHESHDEAIHDISAGTRTGIWTTVTKDWKTRAVGATLGFIAPPFGFISPFIGFAAAPTIRNSAKAVYGWGKRILTA